MPDLIIAISGINGGNRGPHRMYAHFPKQPNLEFLRIDTLPDKILENVDQVAKIALEQIQSRRYDKVYLMGFGMGGAVAAVAADRLNEGRNQIEGIIFLATQPEGLGVLRNLRIPLLFCHGTKDIIVSLRDIEPVYRGYRHKKRFVSIEGWNHDFGLDGRWASPSGHHPQDVADRILAEFSSFFRPPRPVSPLPSEGFLSRLFCCCQPG